MAYTTPLNAKKKDDAATPVTVYPNNGSQSYTGYAKGGSTYTDPYATTQIPSGVTKTTYTDKNGVSNTGYIIGGQTYTDPYGNNRAPLGSIVNTADGKQYQLTSYGGVETYPSAINSLKKSQDDAIGGFYEARNERNAGYNAAAAAAERSYRDRVAQLERDTQLANEQARKAYIEAQNPFGVIAQRNEALGLGDSGYAESTMAALSNEYQRQLNENNRNKQDALADIYAAIEAAKSEAEFNKAMNNAATLEAITAQRAQNADSIMRYTSDAYNTGISMDRYNDTLEYSRGRDAIEDARYEDKLAYDRAMADRDYAWQLLKYGQITPETAAQMGLDVATARAIYNTRFAPKPATVRSSSGARPREDDTYTETDIFNAIKNSGENPKRWLMRYGSKYGVSGEGEIKSFVEAYNEWLGGGNTSKGMNEVYQILRAVDNVINVEGITGEGITDKKEIERMRDERDRMRLDVIHKAMNEGRITREEAISLLKKYGIQ